MGPLRRYEGGPCPWAGMVDRGPPSWQRAAFLLPGPGGTCERFCQQLARLPECLRMIAATYPAEPDAARLADGLAGLTGAPEQIAIIECEDDPIIFGAARAALREHYPHILNPEGCNDALLRGMSGGR